MADVLGSSLDISLFGFNIDTTYTEIDTSSIGTFGYLRFLTDDTGYIPDHTEIAKALLIEQFKKDKPNLHGVVEAFVDQVQNCEDTLQDIYKFRSVLTANGEQLDLIGEMVGQPRTSADDDIYRADIIFKIYVNTSNGEPETLISALDQIVQANSIDYSETYPAGVLLNINVASRPIPENIIERMEQIKPAGVKLSMTYNNSLTPFVFGGDVLGTMPPYYVGEGFGETGAGNESIGGNITEIIT